MTPSQLKAKYIENNLGGLFFDRKTPVKHNDNNKFKFDAKTFKYLGVIK